MGQGLLLYFSRREFLLEFGRAICGDTLLNHITAVLHNLLRVKQGTSMHFCKLF